MKTIAFNILLFLPFFLVGQNVGIGTNAPHESAILELHSDTSGILIPRLSTIQRNNMNSPATSLLIFNSDDQQFQFYNGIEWKTLLSNATLNSSEIQDTDSDTRITTEASTDEDTIKMLVRGQEMLKLDGSRMHISTSSKSTLIGHNAGNGLPSNESWNTLIGFRAGEETSSGISNTMLGSFAGSKLDKGDANTFIGTLAGEENTASNNTFVGIQSGQLSDSGQSNTYVGQNSGGQNKGSENIAIGSWANHFGTGNNNIAIGRHSLYNTANGIGELLGVGDSTLVVSGTGSNFPFLGIRNTAIGHKVLKKNTTGFNNTGLGYHSLENNLNGIQNTALGANASNKNTSGARNTALGAIALFDNEQGSDNTVVGAEAGRFSTGNKNTYVGALSGTNNFEGSGNIYIGSQAGEFSSGSNELIIDNTNTTSPLIHGDFQNDTLTINGSLQIDKAFTFPREDGESGSTLVTNGQGQVSWSEGSSPCETRIPIDTIPFTITEPGSYYITKNLEIVGMDGITIDTNNVVLDINGFTLKGTAGSVSVIDYSGVLVLGENVVVKNGILVGWTTGLFLTGSQNLAFDLLLANCRYGAQISGIGHTVKNCKISRNSRIGLRVTGHRNAILNNHLDNNNPFDAPIQGFLGIPSAIESTGENYFYKNVLSGNVGYGFFITRNCLLEENFVVNTIGTNPTAFYFTGLGDVSVMINNRGQSNFANIGGTSPPPENLIGNVFW